jgi:hypothetical protein
MEHKAMKPNNNKKKEKKSTPSHAIAPLIWSYPTKQESSISNYNQAKNRGRKQPNNPNIKQKKINHGQT